MSVATRRLLPFAVVLVGLTAAGLTGVLSDRWRREDRIASDRRTAALVARLLESRLEALARSVRGPASMFDASVLRPDEVAGLLRMAYAQSDDVTAVTLVDERGAAVVPAVFLSRAGVGAGARPVESLDDLNVFAERIPFDRAVHAGRAFRGPYATARADGTRMALAHAVPVADGTRTWVLAAEIDASRAMAGLATGVRGASAFVIVDGIVAGPVESVSRDALTTLRARSHGGAVAVDGETIERADWRAVLRPAPSGLDGSFALVWSGPDETARHARQGSLALAVLVASLVGALAAALAVALREPRPSGRESDGRDDATSDGLQARVLGAVVKDLANPVAAAVAAAQLIATEPARSRVVETLLRSVGRIERAFRRVARLARAGEEVARQRVDVAVLVAREVREYGHDAEPGRANVAYSGPSDGVTVRADADDLAMLVQALVDSARTMAPQGSDVRVTLRAQTLTSGVVLSVQDGADVGATQRRRSMELNEATRSETAAPVVMLALAARICRDHGARLDATNSGTSVQVVVEFALEE